jgi:hypothetical protein
MRNGHGNSSSERMILKVMKLKKGGMFPEVEGFD